MSIHFSQNTAYWLHKTKAFLHDPPDKAIHIPGHEERTNDLLAALGINSSLSKDEYQQADIIASGMDRSNLPGYNPKDETRNGAINFSESPQLTHPTGSGEAIKIELPELFASPKDAVTETTRAIQELLKADLGDNADNIGQGLSENKKYKGKEEKFSPARFHYLFFMLRRRLSQENIAGLGGLWHRLPADTRMPDHSIWQHCGLVAALASCQNLSATRQASLMVYSLSPVQDFVGRARKLRDYWSGSVLLSWLAFEGIKAVMGHLGADHIIYPSLHDQPLVDDLLQDIMDDQPDWFNDQHKDHTIASFPNKFTCLVPAGQEEEIAEVIKKQINTAWQQLADATHALLCDKISTVQNDPHIKEQFQRQLGSYWQQQWAAVPLVKGEDQDIISNLLHKDSQETAFGFWKDSLKFYKDNSGEGQLYSVSHQLSQALLAAGKACQEDNRAQEQGIKCDLFGEFEIIHYQHKQGDNQNPKPSEDPFWQDIRNKFPTDFGNNERLCSLALVKRLASRVCKKMANHPLQKMFKKADSFPSTTEMALSGWFQEISVKARKDKAFAEKLADFSWANNPRKARRKISESFHDNAEPEQTKDNITAKKLFKLHKVQDYHKYYGILMMDGDRMGKLINGETIAATWQSVLHPDLAKKLQTNFDQKYKKFWKDKLPQKRLVSPATHAAISEALGDFSLYSVPTIIKKYDGRLLYAGGDDVCAILPAATIIDAARELAHDYNHNFINISQNNKVAPLTTDYQPQAGDKLGIYLGTGEDISISAGIIIAHHKTPLGKVISRGHELLDLAKKQGGRNGFAIELDKRSGGGRMFGGKWQEQGDDTSLLDHFLHTATALQRSEGAAMSTSLAYRLATFDQGLLALVNNHPGQLVSFIAKQLDRSCLPAGEQLSPEEKNKQLAQIASHIAPLITSNWLDKDETTDKLPLQSLIIANFIGHCRQTATTEDNQ